VQRNHDALQEAADILARHDEAGLPAAGAPTTVIITMDEASAAGILSRSGAASSGVPGAAGSGPVPRSSSVGVSSTGGPGAKRGANYAGSSASSGLPVSEAMAARLIDEAVLIGLIVDAKGDVVRLGRARRIASRSQTYALIARDKGCSFPGCDAPPHWCQRHHVIPWRHGGATDLDNLTLVCHYHHREHEPRGWTCTIVDGLPIWTAPPWVDPHQIPHVNYRIASQQRAPWTSQPNDAAPASAPDADPRTRAPDEVHT
jgi:hypothetical protein